MRRTWAILASLAALLGAQAFVAPSPTRAHFCANPVELSVGKPGTVNIGIAAEVVPAVAVTVSIPEGFRFERAVEYGPWKATRGAGVVTFRGGTIEPFTCGFFSIVGSATKKGVYPFHLGVEGADGSTEKYTSEEPFGEFAAQMVYAGVPISGPGDGDGGGLPPGAGWAALVALTAGALAVFVASRVSARRS